MIDSSRLAATIDPMIEQPHALGDRSKGWDCLNSLISIYRALGFEFPADFEGITEDTYADLWRNDNRRARAMFGRFLSSLGEAIDPAFSRRGDLLLFRGLELSSIPAINLGNGQMLMVLKGGVHNERVDRFRDTLVGARRLIK